MTRLPLALCLAAAWFPAPSAVAHHSYAAYEGARTVTLTGTVETFLWANPHVGIHLLASGPGVGASVDWDIETSAPGILRRFGWTRGSIRPGDRVMIVLSPMRDGSPHGRLHTLTLVGTGQVLKTKLSGA